MLTNLLSSSYPGRRRRGPDWEDQAKAVAAATERQNLERYRSQGVATWLSQLKRIGRTQRVLELKRLNAGNLQLLSSRGIQVSAAGLDAGAAVLRTPATAVDYLEVLFDQRGFDGVLAWDLFLHVDAPVAQAIGHWIAMRTSRGAPMLAVAGRLADGSLPAADYRMLDGGSEIEWNSVVLPAASGTGEMPALDGFEPPRQYLLRHGPVELVMLRSEAAIVAPPYDLKTSA